MGGDVGKGVMGEGIVRERVMSVVWEGMLAKG